MVKRGVGKQIDISLANRIQRLDLDRFRGSTNGRGEDLETGAKFPWAARGGMRWYGSHRELLRLQGSRALLPREPRPLADSRARDSSLFAFAFRRRKIV